MPPRPAIRPTTSAILLHLAHTTTTYRDSALPRSMDTPHPTLDSIRGPRYDTPSRDIRRSSNRDQQMFCPQHPHTAQHWASVPPGMKQPAYSPSPHISKKSPHPLSQVSTY